MTLTRILWGIGIGFGLLSLGAATGFIAAALMHAARCGDCAIERERNAEPVDYGFAEAESIGDGWRNLRPKG